MANITGVHVAEQVLLARYREIPSTLSLFDGMINGDIFEGWLEQDLIPKLPERSVVIMDKAAFHKRPATQTLLDKAGHTLMFLPPYSPVLNPI
ncbi:MAG: hypothetical protein LEGION0398_MBIBDBAK_00106 [Legionellaceae bacterium]